jgi:hypothetical protein
MVSSVEHVQPPGITDQFRCLPNKCTVTEIAAHCIFRQIQMVADKKLQRFAVILRQLQPHADCCGHLRPEHRMVGPLALADVMESAAR